MSSNKKILNRSNLDLNPFFEPQRYSLSQRLLRENIIPHINKTKADNSQSTGANPLALPVYNKWTLEELNLEATYESVDNYSEIVNRKASDKRLPNQI